MNNKITKKLFKISKCLLSSGVFYHGSNSPDIYMFTTDESKFSLLGTGVYLYKDKRSAENYGSNVYKVKTIGLKIAPINFEFTKEQIVEFTKSLGIDSLDLGKSPSGMSKPIWWATDGWSYFNLDRKVIAEQLKKYMINELRFDGMITVYGNGGIVCVVWNYRNLKPIKI